MIAETICQKGNRIPIEYRKDKEKAILLLKEIKDKGLVIKNKDVYSLASWAGYNIDYYSCSDMFSDVESVTYVGEKPTYDMSIKDGNSYVANGIICHNTTNLPKETSVEDVAKIYTEAWKMKCKGVTIYREGSRIGILTTENTTSNKIVKTNAPKRPKKLPCDVHHITVKGQQYFVLVGLYENEPYEVFADKNGIISKSVKKGFIEKVKRGQYKVVFENGFEIDNLTDNLDDLEEAITRLISSNLRHGADISFLVQQLEKGKGDVLSFEKAIARALKKYVKDGAIKGESCPSCGSSSLKRESGCKSCTQCGWSGCS